MNGLRNLLAIFFLLAAGPAPAADTLVVSNAWIREAPPTSHVLAGYVTLTNTGSEPVVITGVSGPDFSSVEIHSTEIRDGVARMLRHPTLEIGAGASVVLEPGGMHFMLFNPVRPLSAGDTSTLTLTGEPGISLEVSHEVVRRAPGHAHADDDQQ